MTEICVTYVFQVPSSSSNASVFPPLGECIQLVLSSAPIPDDFYSSFLSRLKVTSSGDSPQASRPEESSLLSAPAACCVSLNTYLLVKLYPQYPYFPRDHLFHENKNLVYLILFMAMSLANYLKGKRYSIPSDRINNNTLLYF